MTACFIIFLRGFVSSSGLTRRYVAGDYRVKHDNDSLPYVILALDAGIPVYEIVGTSPTMTRRFLSFPCSDMGIRLGYKIRLN